MKSDRQVTDQASSRLKSGSNAPQGAKPLALSSVDRAHGRRGALERSGQLGVLAAAMLVAACASDGGGTGTPEILGIHMAELSSDFSTVYLTSSEKSELLVLDARTLGADTSDDALMNRAYIVSRHSLEVDVLDLRTLELVKRPDYPVIGRIALGTHPTHESLTRDGSLLAVMDEDEGGGAVSFIDTVKNVEVKRLNGFYTPHFMRFSPDGRYGYVANLNAHHLTRVDLSTLEIDGHIPLDGFDGPPNATEAPDEGGFADAQIDANGTLYAAHSATGRVLVYDTKTQQKLKEVPVGTQPWIVYAEHPFADIRAHVVPNFGDSTVSIINRETSGVTGTVQGADRESFGVNYSPMAANQAFVMNRFRRNIAVVDTSAGEAIGSIDVGGTTETAATTRDGKWIIATVSSANRVVVIDAETKEIVKAFDNVGDYPWSVTIPMGQNYCH